jgi:1-acyl-sn-glycerol-3-phosphate acyltransferase
MASTSLNTELDHDNEPPYADDTGGTGRVSVFWTAFTWAHVGSILVLATLVALLAGWPAVLLGDRYGRVAHACISFGFRFIVRRHPRYRLTLSGLENLPRGGAVLCPNHQSLSDVVYLYSLPLDYRWVIKKELFNIPLLGTALRLAGYLEIDRGDATSATKLVEGAHTLLGAAIPIVTFPEGTRRRDGRLGRFHTGSARMAVLNQVALVPVGVVGTSHLLPSGGRTYPAHVHIGIHVGPPIATAGCGIGEVRALTRELRARVEAAKSAAQRAIDEESGIR